MTRMCSSGSAATYPYQHGFSLPVAIFVITVMALIGAAMVSISKTGQESVASEVQSIRTFYTAETGAQYAMALLFPVTGGTPGCAAVNSATPLNLNFGSLSNCNAALTCQELSLGSDTYYKVSSNGQCTFGNLDTRRSIEVMAKEP